MTNKRLIRFWLIVFIALFTFFVLLQVPAVWLLNKFAPQLRMLHNVSGNIWQGQADWNVGQVQGTVNWSTRPWELLRLRAASHVTIHSGETQIKGVVGYGVGKNIYIQGMSGKVSPETLSAFVKWQWPSESINLNDITVQYKRQHGFKTAEGGLAWSGGMLSYPMGQRVERIDVPPLVADLATEKEKLKMLVRDSQKQRMADLSLGQDGMLDVQITQRFLLNAPSYQGKAGLDSVVVSSRQPLNSLRGM